MNRGNIYMYYGNGKGKTTLAIGQGLRAVAEGLDVVMIQFMDFGQNKEHITLKKLEPNFRLFKFEKDRASLSEADTDELKNELKLALNFSKKILETGECDTLILDGINDAIEAGFIDEKELIGIIEDSNSTEEMDIIITGNAKNEGVAKIANYVYSINKEKIMEKE